MPSFRNGRSSEFESNTCHIVVSPATPGFLAKPKPCFGCNFFTAPKGTQPATSQVCHSTGMQAAAMAVETAVRPLYNWKERTSWTPGPRRLDQRKRCSHPPLKAFPLRFASALVTLVGQCRGSAEKVRLVVVLCFIDLCCIAGLSEALTY